MKIYCALVHYPAYNKNRKVITTSITTSNIHDLSRTARTYGLEAFFFVTPIERQQSLIETIIEHWKSGYGASYNPTRGTALDIIRVCPTLEMCVQGITEAEGTPPYNVVTCASPGLKTTGFPQLRDEMERSEMPWLILFGTGWGLTREVLESADRVLEPIRGRCEYNHLSVRAAVAIVLDRLLG